MAKLSGFAIVTLLVLWLFRFVSCSSVLDTMLAIGGSAVPTDSTTSKLYVVDDINGDGVNDLVSGRATGLVYWYAGILPTPLANIVKPIFNVGIGVPVSTTPVDQIIHIAVMDINSDSYKDIIVSTWSFLNDNPSDTGPGSIVYYINNGPNMPATSQFAEAVTVFTTASPYQPISSISLGDVDNNGLPDIMFALSGPPMDLFWLANLDVSDAVVQFDSVPRYVDSVLSCNYAANPNSDIFLETPCDPVALLVDLNKDGMLDIIMAGFGVRYYLNVGGGNFSDSVIITNSTINPRSLNALDFFAAGDFLQIVIMPYSTGYSAVQIWSIEADDSWNIATQQPFYFAPGCFDSITIYGDFDANGFLDVMAMCYALDTSLLSTAYLFLNTNLTLGSGYQDPNWQLGYSTLAIVSVDLDMDGLLDVFLPESASTYPASSSWLPSVLSPVFGSASVLTAVDPDTYVGNDMASGGPEEVTLGHSDVDHDGYIDLVWVDSQRVWWLRSLGQGNFESAPRSSATSFPASINTRPYYRQLFADMNGDGWEDVLTFAGWVTNLANAANPGFASTVVPYTQGLVGIPFCAGFLRNNSQSSTTNEIPDIVIVQRDPYTLRLTDILVLFGDDPTGAGTVTLNGPVSDLDCEDVTGDGYIDILMIKPTLSVSFASQDHYILLYQNTGNSSFSSGQIVIKKPLGDYLEVMQLSDVDGDGMIDVTAILQSGTVAWYQNLGTVNNDPTLPPQFSNTQQFIMQISVPIDISISDVDGDRLADIVVLSSGFPAYIGVYSSKNMGFGQFGPARTLYQNTNCQGGSGVAPGALVLADFTGSGLPSWAALGCEGFTSSSPAQPLIFAGFNQGLSVNITLDPLSLSATQLNLPADGFSYVGQLEATTSPRDLTSLIARLCWLSRGSSVFVSFVFDLWPAVPFPLILDGSMTTYLRSCNILFVSQQPLVLTWPCDGNAISVDCVNVSRLPRGRVVGWIDVSFFMTPDKAAAISANDVQGSVVLDSCLINGNILAQSTGRFVLVNSTLSPTQGPSAMTLTNTNLTMTTTIVEHARSNTSGAGILVFGFSTVLIFSSVFNDNQAMNGYGGAIFVSEAALRVYATSFSLNDALYGGAVWAGGSTVDPVITNCLFSYNTAQVHGGAVYFDQFNPILASSRPFIIDTAFKGNLAQQGLGDSVYYFSDNANPVLVRSTFDSAQRAIGSRLVASLQIANPIVASAGQATNITITLLDIYNNTYSGLDPLLTSGAVCVASASSNGQTVTVVDQVVQVSRGACYFSSIAFLTSPSAFLNVLVTASVYPNQPSFNVHFSVQLQSCNPGQRVLDQYSCVACEAGLFSSTLNAVSCSFCPSGSVPTADATGCEQCPPGQVSAGFGEATCSTCSSGFTILPGAATCSPCPLNMLCDSSVGLPRSAPGYWAYVNYSATTSSSAITVTQCPSDWCTGGVLDTTGAVTSINGCKEYHLNSSVICGTCDETNDYLWWDGDCRYCPPASASGGLAFLYSGMFLYVCYLYYSSPGHYQTGVINTIVFYVQVLSLLVTIYSVSLNELSLSISWIALFNLDASFGGCPGNLLSLNPSLPSFYVYFWLRIAQPVFMFLMVTALGGLSLILRAFLQGRDIPQICLELFPQSYKSIGIRILDQSPIHLRLAKACVGILLFSYLPVLKVLFTTFHVIQPLTSMSDYVLAFDPSVTSDSSIYRAHLVLAAIFTVIYLPLPFILYITATIRFRSSPSAILTSDHTNELREKHIPPPSDAVIIYGQILKPYHPYLHWVWILLELRKVVVIALVVFLGSFQLDLQNTLLAVVFVILIFILVLIRPLRAEYAHVTEIVALICLVVAVQSRDPLTDGLYFIWCVIGVFVAFMILQLTLIIREVNIQQKAREFVAIDVTAGGQLDENNPKAESMTMAIRSAVARGDITVVSFHNSERNSAAESLNDPEISIDDLDNYGSSPPRLMGLRAWSRQPSRENVNVLAPPEKEKPKSPVPLSKRVGIKAPTITVSDENLDFTIQTANSLEPATEHFSTNTPRSTLTVSDFRQSLVELQDSKLAEARLDPPPTSPRARARLSANQSSPRSRSADASQAGSNSASPRTSVSEATRS